VATAVPAGDHRIGKGVLARVRPRTLAARDGAIACWEYETVGLAPAQREVVFVLRSELVDAAPVEPLAMLAGVARLVGGGERVAVGDWTVFDARGGDPRALCYADPPPGLDAPGKSLLALALVGAEVDLIQSVGATRLLARLGADAGVFPFPGWSDLDRSPVAEAGETSLLDRLSRLRVDGRVELSGMTIRLELERQSADPVRRALDALDPAAPVALLTGVSESADAQLTWRPGQRGPRAVHASAGLGTQLAEREAGDRLAGAFAAFVPSADHDAGILVEDGFCARLSDDTWAHVREALTRAVDCRVDPARDTDYGFELRWRSVSGGRR